MQGRLDPSRSHRHFFVLPHSDDSPASLLKSPIGVGVPLSVASQLVRPPRGVRTGARRMLGTRVPEAAVHEHGDPSADECHVDGSPRAPGHRPSDAITMTVGMEQSPQCQLRPCVHAPLLPHPLRHPRGARRCGGGRAPHHPHVDDQRRLDPRSALALRRGTDTPAVSLGQQPHAHGTFFGVVRGPTPGSPGDRRQLLTVSSVGLRRSIVVHSRPLLDMSCRVRSAGRHRRTGPCHPRAMLRRFDRGRPRMSDAWAILRS